MVFRHSDNEFFMTAAEPNLGYLADLIGRLEVEIEDVTDDYGMLAVQGPRSREILAELDRDIADLRFFEHTETKIAQRAGHGRRAPATPATSASRSRVAARRGARRARRDPRGRGRRTASARSARRR